MQTFNHARGHVPEEDCPSCCSSRASCPPTTPGGSRDIVVRERELALVSSLLANMFGCCCPTVNCGVVARNNRALRRLLHHFTPDALLYHHRTDCRPLEYCSLAHSCLPNASFTLVKSNVSYVATSRGFRYGLSIGYQMTISYSSKAFII